MSNRPINYGKEVVHLVSSILNKQLLPGNIGNI